MYGVNATICFLKAGVTCRSKPEETTLAAAILSIINWLLQVFHHSLCRTQSPTTPIINDTDLLEKSGALLNDIVGNEFMMAMCCLAKYNDIELYNETTKKCYEIETVLKVNGGVKMPVNIEQSLQDLVNLDVDTVSKAVEGVERITYCVQALLAVEVMHR